MILENGDFPIEQIEIGYLHKIMISSCLVFSVGDVSSWEALARLRMMVLTSTKEGARTPVVVVGNKVDLEAREVARAETEARVTFEWNWGYKECSAKLGEGVSQVIRYVHLFWLRQELRKC